jgi:ArsR family transcriptional regulator
MTVSNLTDILGQSQPRVSRHLKLLCDAGVLDRSPEGSRVFYRLADDTSEAGRIARQLVTLIPDDDFQSGLDRQRLVAIKDARSAQAEAYFRANAEQWDRIRSLHVDERDVEQAMLEMFPDHAGDLLDMGTGTGRMLELFADRIDRGTGIDLSRDMLAIARAKLEASDNLHCHVRHGDIYRLEISERSYDAVVIHQVLHYADQPESVIAEAARVLRPGGILLVIDFAPHDLEALRTDHAHHRLGCSQEEMIDWFEAAGFESEKVQDLPGDPLTVTIWKAVRLSADASRTVIPLSKSTMQAVE